MLGAGAGRRFRSSYFEKITGDFKRMNDQEWAIELGSATPDDVPWMKDLVSR
ncbi:hypothetical protein WMF31_24500 [Sorangium sp. So ce1036]|uniref:hypothetical protein n=1 Tax=Sorangium sp. So ce1036 TaxID=3133328 RepID=UPI003F053957